MSGIYKILHILLLVGIICFLFSFAFFMSEYTYKNFVSLPDKNTNATTNTMAATNTIATTTIKTNGIDGNTDAAVGITDNIMDKMTNEGILAILAFILAFVGIFTGILNYAVYKLVARKLHDDLEEEILKLANDERNASRAEVMVSETYLLDRIYLSQEKKDKSLLTAKWEFAEKAFQISKKLTDKKYVHIKFGAKNNHLYYSLFEQQQEKGFKIDPAAKEQMIELNNDLWKSIVSGEAEKFDTTGNNIYHWKETCARIFYYIENKKEKALQIIESIKGCCPEDWYNKIKENYPELKTKT